VEDEKRKLIDEVVDVATMRHSLLHEVAWGKLNSTNDVPYMFSIPLPTGEEEVEWLQMRILYPEHGTVQIQVWVPPTGWHDAPGDIFDLALDFLNTEVPSVEEEVESQEDAVKTEVTSQENPVEDPVESQEDDDAASD